MKRRNSQLGMLGTEVTYALTFICTDMFSYRYNGVIEVDKNKLIIQTFGFNWLGICYALFISLHVIYILRYTLGRSSYYANVKSFTFHIYLIYVFCNVWPIHVVPLYILFPYIVQTTHSQFLHINSMASCLSDIIKVSSLWNWDIRNRLF